MPELNQAAVLVVDDIEDSRYLLARQLRRQGCAVTLAENGRQALEWLRETRFDLVLLDIMMPELSGYEVLEQVKLDPKLRHIPVIVVSALNDIDSVVRCVELGAEDYLFKPFNPVLLKARISTCLERKFLRDQEQAYQAELQMMQRIDCELNSSLDLRRIAEVTLNWALEYVRGDAGLIGIVEKGKVVITARRGYDAEFSSDENLSLFLDMLLQPSHKGGGSQPRWLVLTANGNDKYPGVRRAGQGGVVAPICRADAVIGLLLVGNTSGRQYSAEAGAFLTRLAGHAASAIANAQLHAAVQAANDAKSEFVSVVAHELRTPMTAIKGYADLLSEGTIGEINERQAAFLNTIRANVERMAALVADLSDISRIEAGQLRLEFSDMPLVEVVDEVVQSTRGQIERKKQRLVQQIPADLPAIWGDRIRVSQILTNLVSNAYKYTPEGGEIVIWAEYRAGQAGAVGVVHIAVQDNGFGIALEDQDKIFQKFFRGAGNGTHDTPGTGLGLNVAKSLVEMQGGEIWFESECGAGSTFHFTMPVAAVNLRDA